LEGRLPGFPIWADVFFGSLNESPDHPVWKNRIIRKNTEFFTLHETIIRRWLERHRGLNGLAVSFRKLEWQAGEDRRDIWEHAIQFRPSGIRVRPLTYLPALVAITQTSIIGPRRRRITPREAAKLQGVPSDFPFVANPAVAYRQLGNAVSVGTARLVARTLLSDFAELPLERVPPEWQMVLRIAEGRYDSSANLLLEELSRT
jgi:DNA (cytosine-5)-methyltransferase 1